ncbi:MAG: hypothetical protein Q9171_005193 [Xanthocarpia ochracea]
MRRDFVLTGGIERGGQSHPLIEKHKYPVPLPLRFRLFICNKFSYTLEYQLPFISTSSSKNADLETSVPQISTERLHINNSRVRRRERIKKGETKRNMCFFDQHRFACGDWKWGHFRQHCNREYRTGETCGMKLIMQTVPVSQKCKLCDKIDTKQRRRSAEEDRINRWKREGGKFRASIERSYEMIKSLDREIYDLRSERMRKLQAV